MSHIGRHESYKFMTVWSCVRRLVPNSQVRLNCIRYLRLKCSCTGLLDAELPSLATTTTDEIVTWCRKLTQLDTECLFIPQFST